MADQGRWFKLWCTAAQDPHLDNLEVSDFGRWAKFGAYMKAQGTGGILTISAPSRFLCAALQVSNFDALLACLRRLPNIELEEVENRNGEYVVTFKNWRKYQEDQTNRDRQKRFRDEKRNDLRGEEKRREEKRREENTPIPPKGPTPFDRFWTDYPKKTGKLAAKKAWDRAKINGKLEEVLGALAVQKTSEQWTRDGGQYIPNPATWINQGRWQDEPTKAPDWRDL